MIDVNLVLSQKFLQMKKMLTLLSVALLWTGLGFAQNSLPHADISVQTTSPSADTVVPYGDSLYISFNYTNNGPDMLPAGDTLFFGFGGLVMSSVLTQPMLPGNTFVYNNVAYFYNPTDSLLSFDLCVGVLPQNAVQYTNGAIPATTYIDDDSTNDFSCHQVVLQGPDTTPNAIQNVAAARLNNLQVYPNPVTDRIYFDMPATLNSKTVSVSVYDILGKSVLTKKVENFKNEASASINLSTLPSGVYSIVLQSAEQSWRAKFVKQ